MTAAARTRRVMRHAGGGGGGSTLRPLLLLAPLVALAAAEAAPTTDDERPVVQSFIREPTDVSFEVGETATLPCQVDNKRGSLQWTKDGFGLGIGRNLTGFDRYRMIGNNEEGDYTLEIKPVLLDDDATYQCQVGATEEAEAVRSREGRLTVKVPTLPPFIVNGDQLSTTESRRVTIECESRGGKPAAEIKWFINEDSIEKSNEDYSIEETKTKIGATLRETTRSKLKFSVTKSHHDAVVKCEACDEVSPDCFTTTLSMKVKYAPDVNLTADHEHIKEGEDVAFTCSARANPEQMAYRWLVDDVLVSGIQGTEHRIESIGRALHDKIVKCEVTNSIGKSEETMTLNINYPPVWLIEPLDTSDEKGAEVTLSCAADGNPQPTYTWYRNGYDKEVRSFGGDLKLRISQASVGKYICQASVPHYRQIETSVRLLMKGKPNIIRKDAVQFGSEGDTVHLRCSAFSIPPPATLTWRLYASEVGHAGGDPHFTKTEQQRVDGMDSTLVVHGAVHSDFHKYNCSVKNSHGGDSFIVDLQKRENLPLIIIVAACVSSVVLTVATILVVVWCRRAKGGGGGAKSMDSKSVASTSNGAATDRRGGGSGAKTAATALANGSSSATTSASSRSSNHGSELTKGAASSSLSAAHAAAGGASSSAGAGDPEWDDRTDCRAVAAASASAAASAAQRRTFAANQAFEDYPTQMDLSYGDSFGVGLPSGSYVSYGAGFQQPPPPPPPPPHPNLLNGASVDALYRGLNVSDPRYAAKYGNPYLRQSPVISANNSPLMSPHHFQHHRGGGGSRPYATLNTRSGNHSYSPASAAAAGLAGSGGVAGYGSGGGAAAPKNATMIVDNGFMSLGGGGGGNARVMAVDGGAGAKAGRRAQYIVSPQDEVAAGALATHV